MHQETEYGSIKGVPYLSPIQSPVKNAPARPATLPYRAAPLEGVRSSVLTSVLPLPRPGIEIFTSLRLSRRPHHRLGFEKFLEALDAPFTAVTGLLVAAEWRGKIRARAVDMDVTGAQLSRDFQCV